MTRRLQPWGRASGPLTALNSQVALDCGPHTIALLQITAAAVVGLTVVVEGSIDSTDGINGTWLRLGMSPTDSANLYTQVVDSGVLAAQPTIGWEVRVTPFQWVRARASAWTSGTTVLAILQPTDGEM